MVFIEWDIADLERRGKGEDGASETTRNSRWEFVGAPVVLGENSLHGLHVGGIVKELYHSFCGR